MVGTFTYDVTNDIITVTGGTAGSPVGFIDFWNADKAGTLSLHARTGISGVDGSPVNLTWNARPTDRVVLGGAKQDLYVVVTAWTNMTSATVKLIGTDTSGAAQTEDLSITGNGTYYATKYYATLTQTQVTAFNGTGSFAYEVKQGQWGVVWKQSTNGFMFDCRIAIGDGSTATYFTDYAKQITFSSTAISANGQNWLVAQNNATTTFGRCADAIKKTTYDGIVFAILDAAHYGYFAMGGTSYIYYYSCEFWSAGGTIFIRATRIWNCLLDTNSDPNLVQSGGDIDTLIATKAYRGLRCYVGVTIQRVFLIGCTYGIFLGGAAGPYTISNPYTRYCTNTLYLSYLTSNVYIINWDSDTYACSGDNSTGTVYRQYTFDLRVTDKAGNPIPGATVTVKDTNGTLVFCVTTKADGTIDTQTITRTTYSGSNGGTVTDYAPHALTIIKAGYQTYVKTFVLSAKTSWEIKLAKAQALLLDSGSPVVNLSPTDPENKMVLAL